MFPIVVFIYIADLIKYVSFFHKKRKQREARSLNEIDLLQIPVFPFQRFFLICDHLLTFVSFERCFEAFFLGAGCNWHNPNFASNQPSLRAYLFLSILVVSRSRIISINCMSFQTWVTCWHYLWLSQIKIAYCEPVGGRWNIWCVIQE